MISFSDAWSGIKDAVGDAYDTVLKKPFEGAAQGLSSPDAGPPGVDPNAYQYGGHGATAASDVPLFPGHPEFGMRHTDGTASGADQATGRYQGMGAAAGARGAPSADMANANADRSQGAQSRGMGVGDRGNQTDALGLMRSAANGGQPSVAQNQLYAGRDAAIDEAAAQANSARGGAQNIAAAQRFSADTAAHQIATTNQQAAQLRAGEMAQARGQYEGAANDLRQSDFAQRAQDLQSQGLDAQTAMQRAQLELASRGENDQTQLGYERMGAGVQSEQLQAQMAKQAEEDAKWKAQMGQDETSKKDNESNWWNFAGGVSGLVSPHSDARTKEGIRFEGGGWGGGGGNYADDGGGIGFSGPGAEAANATMHSLGGDGTGGMGGGGAPYMPRAPSGGQRFMMSDREAKQHVANESFRQGMEIGQRFGGALRGGAKPNGKTRFGGGQDSGEPYMQYADGTRVPLASQRIEGGQVIEEPYVQNADGTRAELGGTSRGVTYVGQPTSAVQANGAPVQAAPVQVGGVPVRIDDQAPQRFSTWMAPLEGGARAPTQFGARPAAAPEPTAPVPTQRVSKISDKDAAKLERSAATMFSYGPEPTAGQARFSDPLTQGAEDMQTAMGARFSAPPAVAAGPQGPTAFNGAVPSDERLKSGAKRSAPSEMLEQLKPYSYNYREGTPGEDPGKRRFGVMAQDLEKSPMGRSIVEETPHGKVIDVPHATGVQFAALANLHDRLRRVEKGRG